MDAGVCTVPCKIHQFGLVDHWLRPIRDIYAQSYEELSPLSKEKQFKKLVKYNVEHQLLNICHTTIVQNAWIRNQELQVHGWVYDMASGNLENLGISAASLDDVPKVYHTLLSLN